jgi:heterodisulfide reductase subunit D
MEKVIDQIASCTECEECMESCPTFQITGEKLFSPLHRLQTVHAVLEGRTVSEQMVESLYNCPKCMACETVCPVDIKITQVVDAGRRMLVQRGSGPLERGKKIIEGILKRGNAVNGDPSKRLAWLPEAFPRRESETLLFLGCLPSYLVKDAASASYLALQRLDIDCMILEDEGCCGTYIYEAGDIDLAREYFQKNVDRFTHLGIKNLIVPCNGCLKCFKYFYPELLGEFPFQVSHVVEVIYNTLKQNPSVLKKVERSLVYQDACRLARGEGMTEEPRELLSWCGAKVKDTELNRQQAPCCGSGGGIRSLYRDLSTEMASRLLAMAPGDTMVSACPFCTFHLRATAQTKELGKEVVYITRIILDSIKDR